MDFWNHCFWKWITCKELVSFSQNTEKEKAYLRRWNPSNPCHHWAKSNSCTSYYSWIQFSGVYINNGKRSRSTKFSYIRNSIFSFFIVFPIRNSNRRQSVKIGFMKLSRFKMLFKLLEYRGHSITTLTHFLPYLTTYLPPVDMLTK